MQKDAQASLVDRERILADNLRLLIYRLPVNSN